MNFGQRGRDLLLDLKRSDWLPPYDDGVRATLKETSLHFDELSDKVNATRGNGDNKSNPPPFKSRPSLLLHDAAIRRNKRCLLAYHAYRVDKLRELRWETAAGFTSHHRALLSETEIDFFSEYDRLVSRHAARVDLDLSSDLTPPEEDFIEVRVAQHGIGRIATEGGSSVALDIGTTHHIRRGDVEHLIRQGVLQQLNCEESC